MSFITLAQWTDDFSDNDFTTNPAWSGESANFEINTSQQLHLNAPAQADTSYLFVDSDVINSASWQIDVHLDFATSSSNLARVYLVSNQSDLKSALNGYFIQIGGTYDEVSLYRQDGTTTTPIIDGIDGFVGTSTVNVRVQVSRSLSGDWEVFADTTAGFTSFVSQGTVNDDTYFSSAYFGVFCKYSSTRSDKFYFDNFIVSGSAYVDVDPPLIEQISVVSDTEIDVGFSEDINQSIAENVSNYLVNNGIGNPTAATLDATFPFLVHLEFSNAFTPNQTYELTIQNIEDLSANVMSMTTVDFIYYQLGVGSKGSVIVSEFMADPADSVGLPEQEYIELYNASDSTYQLNGWVLSDGSSNETLSSYVLLPNTYVLLVPTNYSSAFGVINVMEGDWPSLNNSSDAIIIKNGLNQTIDSLVYTTDWYQNDEKSDGGWSLERKYLSALCSDINNWSVSENVNGGTPGVQNSIFTNQVPEINIEISSVFVPNDTTLEIKFNNLISETNLSLVIDSDLTLNNWQVNQNELIVWTSQMQVNDIHTLQISQLNDCWLSQTASFNVQFGLPDSAQKGDVFINEILFNPVVGGSDYVELINVSNKILDASQWQLAHISDGIIDDASPISAQGRLLFPNEYLTITEDSANVIENYAIYGIGTFIQTDLPTYPDDSGTVVLLYNQNVLDQVHYDEDYQFELLDSREGKSLERISTSLPSNQSDNWHTASEFVGWGTPGYQNSQYQSLATHGNIEINRTIFSPDNDGYQDVLIIQYEFEQGDNVMDIEIYDAEGRLVRELKDNFYPGLDGAVIWDGMTDMGVKAAVGNYIVLVTVFDLNGNKTVFKKAVVLAIKL